MSCTELFWKNIQSSLSKFGKVSNFEFFSNELSPINPVSINGEVKNVAIQCNDDDCERMISPYLLVNQPKDGWSVFFSENPMESRFEVFCDTHNRVPLFCSCLKPFSEISDLGIMLGCDACMNWYHEKCVKTKADFEGDSYLCPDCKRLKQEGLSTSQNIIDKNRLKEKNHDELTNGGKLLQRFVTFDDHVCKLVDAFLENGSPDSLKLNAKLLTENNIEEGRTVIYDWESKGGWLWEEIVSQIVEEKFLPMTSSIQETSDEIEKSRQLLNEIDDAVEIEGVIRVVDRMVRLLTKCPLERPSFDCFISLLSQLHILQKAEQVRFLSFDTTPSFNFQ